MKGDFCDETIVIIVPMASIREDHCQQGVGEFRLGSSKLSGVRKQSNVLSSLRVQLHREIHFMP